MDSSVYFVFLPPSVRSFGVDHFPTCLLRKGHSSPGGRLLAKKPVGKERKKEGVGHISR